MLCEKCSNIQFTKLEHSSCPPEVRQQVIKDPSIEHGGSYLGSTRMFYLHHDSRQALETSIARGCHFCAMIFVRLFVQPSGNGWFQPTPGLGNCIVLVGHWLENWSLGRFVSELIYVQCGDKVSNYLSLGSGIPVGAFTALTNLKDSLESEEEPNQYISNNLDSHTGSLPNIALARYWLENCRSEHSWCRSGGSATSQLPKRIIDVSEPRRPRLKEPDGHTGDYAALSYCWGTIPQLQTTEENYLQHTIGLDLDSLPQSITDAITVTYQLGFKYLWVDALCIIQDSKVDVAEQVSRMDQIYHDSTLTIAAAHGTSVHTGLFVNRDSRLTKPCKVNISLRTATDTLSEDFIFTHRSEEEKHLPLYTRGWVLQEEILPSRKLIFGSFMISWHCMMGYQSESYHSVNPADLSSGKDTEKLSHWIRNPKLMNSQEQKRFQGRRDNIFDSWYRVVSKYSTRRLTHDCDKLPAIAGLAASIKRVQNSTYLAGLWAEDFQRGLAWYIESGRHNCSPDDAGNFEELPLSRASSAYIAPSWSWASVKGNSVTFREWENNHNQRVDNGLSLLGWDCLKSSPNEFGPVTEGHVEVKGLLKCALLARFEPSTSVEQAWSWFGGIWIASALDPESGKSIGRVALDSPPQEDFTALGTSRAELRNIIVKLPLDWKAGRDKQHIQEQKIQLGSSIWCLLCLVRQKDPQWQLTCLALVPTNKQRNEYRRVGLVDLHDQEWIGFGEFGFCGDFESKFLEVLRIV